MTYALDHVEINDDNVPCVIREDDGGYLTLHDTNAFIELKRLDPEAFAAVLALTMKLMKYEFMDSISA